MKNKLKKLLRFGFALLTISLLLTNCEKETKEEIQAESQESTLILKHYSKQDIEKNPKLVSRLNKFNDKLTKYKSENVSARTVYNSEYDFTINTNLATYIENGDYHSYTFPLVQDDDEKMTNVMFELNDQGEYDAFLVKYDYTANEFNTLDLTSLSLVTSMEPIDLDFNSLSARRNVAYICVFTYDSHCCDNWVPGYGCGELTGAAYYNYGCDWSLTAQYCETVYYQEEDSTTYNNNTATVTIGGTTYGGSSGGSHTSPMPSPFNAEELMKINVVKSELELNHPERVWIDEWVNGQYAFQLYDFGATNMWSVEAKAFGKSAFRDMMLNKKVDLEESFASPFNLDLELVRPTILNPEPEKVKFMCIYNKLIKSPKFKKLFIDTFGESENLHVKFKLVDNIPPVPPSTTSPNGITKTRLSVNPTTGEITGYDAVIEINKGNMGVSSISLAKTILHESIHAYLTVKQYGCNQGTPLDGFDDVELSELLNMYFSTACPAQSDHEFMFDYLLPTMSEILADIKDDLVPLSHQQEAEGNYTFIDESNPTGPEIPWDWNKFYKYLSMNGLQNSNAFINNVLNSPSKLSNFNSYGSLGVNGFSKECND